MHIHVYGWHGNIRAPEKFTVTKRNKESSLIATVCLDLVLWLKRIVKL